MTDNETTLCDFVEDAALEDIKARVRDPAWICKACGRAANSEKYLCEPVEL
ncbi:MAG: hypothetical protein ACW99U_06130 [Candidatus Thorarchaeota archaeon]|jgi:hypothetical protein